MAERELTLTVSEDVVNTLRMGYQDLYSEMRYEIAKKYFVQKRLSLGKAAALASMNRLEFMDSLGKDGVILFDFDEVDLESEMEGVNKLHDLRL